MRCLFFLMLLASGSARAMTSHEPAQDCVILLHGLARTAHSMTPVAEALTRRGYQTVNVDYPSRSADIASLAQTAIPKALEKCGDYRQVHFVTHSLGGILVRYYLRCHSPSRLGNTVMLGPPNQGSAVVDIYDQVPWIAQWAGPAFSELSAEFPQSVPQTLGAVNFPLAVIAGNRSLNPVLSIILEGEDDGKVTVASTKVNGMKVHRVLPVTHVFMMRDPEVLDATFAFLATGDFPRF